MQISIFQTTKKVTEKSLIKSFNLSWKFVVRNSRTIEKKKICACCVFSLRFALRYPFHAVPQKNSSTPPRWTFFLHLSKSMEVLYNFSNCYQSTVDKHTKDLDFAFPKFQGVSQTAFPKLIWNLWYCAKESHTNHFWDQLRIMRTKTEKKATQRLMR